MWDQVRAFGAAVKQIDEENPGGIHLLCYSQGGLICRGIIESFSSLNVSTFVSLSSPQGGQYGGNLFALAGITIRETTRGNRRCFSQADFPQSREENGVPRFLHVARATLLGG